MIDVNRLETFFARECTPAEFAEQMHEVMTEFVLMAAHAGCDANLNTVAMHIEFLDGVRTALMDACREEE